MLKTAVGQSDDIETSDAAAEIIEACRDALGGLAPTAGLLFAGVEHEHGVLLEALNRAFSGLALIGCTTNGEVSSAEGFLEDSATLILFASDDVQITAGVGRNASADPTAAVEAAVAGARSGVSKTERFCITTPESLTVSTASILEPLRATLGVNFPIFGGTAADQWQFERTRQFFGTEVLTDAVPILLFSGPVVHSFGIASGWSPIGAPSPVTQVDGNALGRIGQKTALAFYHGQLGEHTTPSGEYPLAVYESPDVDRFYLRAPLQVDSASGSITFGGDIPENALVQITRTSREAILAATREAAQACAADFGGDRLEAVLVFSCAARKENLGTRTEEEYEIVNSYVRDGTAVCGFYCYGEVGPLASGLPTAFHNETIVTLAIGQ